MKDEKWDHTKEYKCVVTDEERAKYEAKGFKVTERGIVVKDDNCFIHTDFCVKTQEEVDAILKEMGRIYYNALMRQACRERGIKYEY